MAVGFKNSAGTDLDNLYQAKGNYVTSVNGQSGAVTIETSSGAVATPISAVVNVTLSRNNLSFTLPCNAYVILTMVNPGEGSYPNWVINDLEIPQYITSVKYDYVYGSGDNSSTGTFDHDHYITPLILPTGTVITNKGIGSKLSATAKLSYIPIS